MLAGRLQWPHSGFYLHIALWVPEDDRAFAKRLARYCARNPVALDRLTSDGSAKQVTYRSDKSDGPTAGTGTADPLEFLARVLTHIPDKGQVTTRYYGLYANRPRWMRRQPEPADSATPVPIAPTRPLAPTAPTGRWAALLQQIFEVDPLACPRCGGTMRIISVGASRRTRYSRMRLGARPGRVRRPSAGPPSGSNDEDRPTTPGRRTSPVPMAWGQEPRYT